MRMQQSLFFLAAALLLAGPVTAEETAAPSRVTVNIEPQPLRDALSQFASQTGFQVLRRDEDVALEGLMAPRVVGTYTPDAAMNRLLANSGLSYEFVNPRTVRISGAQPDPGKRTGAAMARTLTLARVADAQTGGAGARSEKENAAEPEQSDTKGIPEMLVKGKRSSNSDIQRTEDDVQPYVVFAAEDIKRSMAGNLEDFLKTRLPMNAAATSNAQVATSFNGTQSSIDLRGMGPNQTLILVNGRRMPGVFTGFDLLQPDINGIPLSSVERIEVLPSTAGGIYGGGATGGVVNIILKSDFTGLDLNARYDNTFDSDVGRRSLEGTAGFNFHGGKTQFLLSAAHAESADFSVGDRDFQQRARNLLLKNNPAYFYNGAVPYGATANFRSANGSPLMLDSGQALGSSFGYVPYGYAGPAFDSGQALLATAGRYNLDLPAGANHNGQSLLQRPTTTSASLSARQTLSERIELFLDASMYNNSSHSVVGIFPETPITLPANAPNNPFTQNIVVQFAAPDFNYASDYDATSKTVTVGGGATIRLPHAWSVQGGYNWSRSRSDNTNNLQALTAAGSVALANGTLDIMRDVMKYPLGYSIYYYTPEPSYFLAEPQETLLKDATLRLAGPAFNLPAGPLMLSTLIERRDENPQRGIVVGYFIEDFDPFYFYLPARSQRTDSAYIEATAPLISKTNALPWVRSLDLQASFRRDNTTTHTLHSTADGQPIIASPDGPFPPIDYVVNKVQGSQYTLGLRYRPADAMALRVSYGASVLPPSLSQLVPLIRHNFNMARQGVRDPKRGNTLAGTPIGSNTGLIPELRALGSPDLLPEQARSWSAGFVFTPKSLPGLRTSIDYTRITKSDEILQLQFQELFNYEDSFPGRIVRAPLTPQEQALGYTGGMIQLFNDGNTNLAHSRIEAYDVQTDYQWDTGFGSFTANLIATYTAHLKRQALATSPETDSVGYTFGPLKLRGNGGLTWDRGPWTAAWNMQYYDSYLVYAVTDLSINVASKIQGQGSPRIPHQVYHDLFVKYRFDGTAAFGRGFLADAEVALGLSNVFNTSPPIIATDTDTVNSYSTYGDPRLRRYSVSLRKSFK